MGFILYIAVMMGLLYCFTRFEEELESLDLDPLTDGFFNWMIAACWPFTMLYFLPVGLAKYFKSK